jgi:hypothetical protein
MFNLNDYLSLVIVSGEAARSLKQVNSDFVCRGAPHLFTSSKSIMKLVLDFASQG